MIETLKLRLEKLPLSQIPYFSSTLLDYLSEDPKLKEFSRTFPTPAHFADVIKQRDFPSSSRGVLANVLEQQYSQLSVSEKVSKNIKQLRNHNCFTITTGHQLNIFTGPLFFVYKIVSTINACKMLKDRYPQYDFVPVYWMASEDHDFAEINHIELFGKQYQWNREWQGAVGRMSLEGMPELLDQISECPDLFKKAYQESEDLAEATLRIVNNLFGDHGLVALDADHADLKRLFSPVMKDDLLHQTAYRCVLKTSEALDQKGYKTLVTPREINLFYLEDQYRNRIVEKNQHYEVLNRDTIFDQKEILEKLERHPEMFSPNVIMRTLYQETALPNLAYVGGPGEISYWLQFKSTFDHYHIPFPVLIPRNNVLMVNRSIAGKIEKLGVSMADLFKHPDQLKATFLEENAKTSLNLESQKEQIISTFQEISDKIKAIDGSLTGFVKAEESKTLKQLSHIEKRLKKAEERNQELAVKQLLGVKEKLFPDGNLQERQLNMLNFYINNTGLIEDLMVYLNPFDFNFHVLLDDG